jgi:hypothetical protein
MSRIIPTRPASATWRAVLVVASALAPARLPAQSPTSPPASAAPLGVQGSIAYLPVYNSKERLKDYFKRTTGLRPILASAAAAGIQQARNAPSAWGQGMKGYGRRYGSSFAKRGISNTVQLGVEAMLGEDSRYVYSERRGFWPRLQDAVASSIVVRTTDGGRQVAFGRIAGTMAGGLLSRQWQPQGHDGIGDGLQSGGLSFGGYVGWNVLREFTRGISKHLPF